MSRPSARDRLLAAPAPIRGPDAPALYGLLLAYLEAQKRAPSVLADFLAESGLEPLAPGADAKRVRRAIALLPPLLAHELACEFVEHVLDQADDRALDQEPRPSRAVAAKRAWLAGEVDDASLKQARAAARQATADATTRRQHHLVAICDLAATAASASASPQIAMMVASRAPDAAYALARTLPQMRRVRGHAFWDAGAMPNAVIRDRELDWQKAHVEALLGRLARGETR